MRQIGVISILVTVKLGKYKIPEFNIPVTFTARLAVRASASVCFSPVKINLGARAAWTGADFPEVIILTKPYNSLLRHTNHVSPERVCFIVIFIYSCPEPVNRHVKVFSNKLPGPGDSFFFEIITKGKISHHFEEGTVSVSEPHVFDITCSYTLLACCHSL